MHFSIICGLSFMCVTALLFLPSQGTLECANPSALVNAAGSKLIDNHLGCCHNVSMDHIKEHVKACYEQPVIFSDCNRHAFILKGNSDFLYCVDPHASWLPTRLAKLKKRGINCKVLGKL